MIQFIKTIGFEKSLKIIELLGADKLIDLTQTISSMKFPKMNLEYTPPVSKKKRRIPKKKPVTKKK